MKLSVKLLLALVLLNLSCMSQSVAQRNTDAARTQGIVLSDVPQKVDTKARYLFYLHGRIVEQGRRPVSPQHGVYEYDQILSVFRQNGFAVISEQRKKDTDIEQYGAKVAGQVRQLLKAGVPPKQITVVGASQGSWIAMLASTYLENRNLNFVFIAACSADDGFLKFVNLHGNVLSIYEKSDLAQSCQKYRADATGIGEWKEVEVNTGLKHGFLYRPMKEWTEPTIAWAQAHSEVSGSRSLEQELMQLQYVADEAENKKDLATLDRLLADNYIFTAPTGAVSDKKQLIEDIKNGEPEAGQTISYDEIKVYDYGNTAIVNCLLIVKGKDKDGKDYTNRYRNTVTWVKQQNRWRMAAIHVSRVRV